MRNLLITTIGEYNHFNRWTDGIRNFDIAIINYDSHDISQEFLDKCVWYGQFPTFKFPGIQTMLKNDNSLLKYDYYWMPDSDIDISCDDINDMFEKANILGLDLGQPSVEKSDVSFPSWEQFIHKEGIDVVMTNFVEVMCPLFSRYALIKCLNTFSKSQSGWGLDLVWAKLVNNGNNMAILNSITIKHTRPVKKGGLYEALAKKKVSPSSERKQLMREYNIPCIDIKTWI